MVASGAWFWEGHSAELPGTGDHRAAGERVTSISQWQARRRVFTERQKHDIAGRLTSVMVVDWLDTTLAP